MNLVRRGGKCPWLGFLVIDSYSLMVAWPRVASGPPQPDPVLPAVVQLLAIGPGESGKNRECSATGFLVNEAGYILTNAHVVEKAQQCLAASPGARILAKLAGPDSRAAPAIACQLVGLDRPHDLALLKTERPPQAGPARAQPAFLTLDPAEVPLETPAKVTGHPGFAWQPVTQSGKIVRHENLRISEETSETTEVIVVNIPLKPGNSGSPVYLEAGGVVGIVERRAVLCPSETVAVPISYAIELLSRQGVRWYRSGEGTPRSCLRFHAQDGEPALANRIPGIRAKSVSPSDSPSMLPPRA